MLAAVSCAPMGGDGVLHAVWAVSANCAAVYAHCCFLSAQVVSGQALQSICLTARGSGNNSGDEPTTTGCLRLTWWILIFSASQLVLCLLPDINSLTAVTALGAATTLGFAVLATVGAAVHGALPHIVSSSYEILLPP